MLIADSSNERCAVLDIIDADDLAELMDWQPCRGWYVVCYDPYAWEWYPAIRFIGPELMPFFFTKETALRDAHERMHENDDEIYVLEPSGRLERIWPDPRCAKCSQ